MAYDDNPGDQTAPWINYVLVPSSFNNAGNTTLTTGKAYVCWRVEDLSALTEAQANDTTGSVKQIVFALAKEFYDWFAALATADRPGKMTIEQVATSASGLASTLRHYVETDHTASTTVDTE